VPGRDGEGTSEFAEYVCGVLVRTRGKTVGGGERRKKGGTLTEQRRPTIRECAEYALEDCSEI